MTDGGNRVLELRGLRVSLDTEQGTVVPVEDSSLILERGQTLALVGESGAGKTMTAMAIMGLAPPTARIETGEILFRGQNLFELSPAELRALRGKELSMIFQDPMTALNPLMTVGDQLGEVMATHGDYHRTEIERRCVEALVEVGLPDAAERLRAFPHELSGGQRQRVMIAMAILMEPALLIADEPTTALDVTVQAQILELLARLQREHGTAILLVTHDLGVVANMAHKVAVMYDGAVVEVGRTEEVFRNPFHPYTFALLQSLPNASTPLDEPLPTLPGQPPGPFDSLLGCRFEPRCPFRLEACRDRRPTLDPLRGPDGDIMQRARSLSVGSQDAGNSHRAACFEQERVGSLTGLWSQSLDWSAQALEAAEPQEPEPPAPDAGGAS